MVRIKVQKNILQSPPCKRHVFFKSNLKLSELGFNIEGYFHFVFHLIEVTMTNKSGNFGLNKSLCYSACKCYVQSNMSQQ